MAQQRIRALRGESRRRFGAAIGLCGGERAQQEQPVLYLRFGHPVARQHAEHPLDAALRGYDATTDFPAATFVDELARRHPAAKVVLSTRDAGDWARSVRSTIWHPQFLEKHWLFRLLLGRRAQDMCRMYRERFFGGAEPSLDDVDALKRAFRAHEARVRRTVPADRLLVHRATDGWAPLCAFLGKPIPDAPYPRVNDAASFRRHIHLVQAFLVVFYGGLVVAGGYVVRRLLWR